LDFKASLLADEAWWEVWIRWSSVQKQALYEQAVKEAERVALNQAQSPATGTHRIVVEDDTSSSG
jgi:hypothetical protein